MALPNACRQRKKPAALHASARGTRASLSRDAAVSGKPRVTANSRATPHRQSSRKIARHPRTDSTAVPSDGARTGATATVVVAWARRAAAAWPKNRSRMTARASTGPTQAPTPCAKQQARRAGTLGATGAAQAGRREEAEARLQDRPAPEAVGQRAAHGLGDGEAGEEQADREQGGGRAGAEAGGELRQPGQAHVDGQRRQRGQRRDKAREAASAGRRRGGRLAGVTGLNALHGQASSRFGRHRGVFSGRSRKRASRV